METFIEHRLAGVITPVMLPEGYAIVNAAQDKIVYNNAQGERVEHYTYMDHAQERVVVDEFRKLFPHDSIVVVLYDKAGNLYLQRRSKAMRWEPDKIDLVSVAAQRRAELVGDHYEAVDLTKLVLAKVAEETGLPSDRITASNLYVLGEHQNLTTNEFQTVYAYHLEADAEELNLALEQVEDIYKAQYWEKRPYKQVLEQYFSEGVEGYAGGAALRPLNFISNQGIQAQLDVLINI